MKTYRILHLANTASEAPGQLIGAANALELDEQGWAEIPYGDHPHSGADGRRLANSGAQPQRIVQRFQREHAEKFVADFKSLWGRIKRAVAGVPIFKGHPDAPRYANLFPDKRERGVIADMEAGPTGLRIRPVLTPDGVADVESGFKFFSPYWESIHTANAADGTAIYEPARLFSLGLVTRGNIPTVALTNAAEPAAEPSTPEQESTTMPKWLIDLLVSVGLLQAESATEEAARAALEQHFAGLKAQAEEAAAAKARSEELATANAALTAEVGALKSQANTAAETIKTLSEGKTALANSLELERTALKAERRERATLLANAAVAEGRLPASDRDARISTLCNAADFPAEAAALAALPKQLKTASALGQLSQEGRATQNLQQQVLGLVNAAMDSAEIQALPDYARYDAAFDRVRKDPKNAPLFAAMKQPGS